MNSIKDMGQLWFSNFVATVFSFWVFCCFVCFLMCNAARKLTLGTRVLSAKRWSSIFHLQMLITETGRNEDVVKWGEKERPASVLPYVYLSLWFPSYFCRGVQTRSLPACPAAPRGPRRRSWEPLCWLVTGNPGRPRLQQRTYQWADSNTRRGNTWLFHSTFHTNAICGRAVKT